MLKKRILSVILCLCMVAGMLPAMTTTAMATSKTADDAIAWADDQVGHSVGRDDGSGYYQCIEFIQAYYQWLGVGAVSGSGADYATNYLPSGWTRTAGGIPQKGDILVYSGSPGHVAIYESDEWLYDQNGAVKGATVEKRQKYYRTSDYWGCIHPNFVSAVPVHYAYTQDLGDDFYAYIYNPMSSCNLESRNHNVQLASVNGSDFRQIWHFIRQDETSYKIINMFDGRCLDTNGPENGGGVQTLPYVGNELQKWRFYGQSSSGPFYVSPYRYNSDHAQVLDISNAGTTPGTNIQLIQNSYKETGAFHPAQTFQVNKIDNIGKISIGNDFYAYMNHSFSGLNVGNVDGNVELVTAAQYDPKQIWHFIWDDTRSAYKITNAYDDYCLDANPDSSDNGNIRMDTDNGGITERWWACGFKGEERYYFTPAYLGDHRLAMDVAWGNVAPVLPGTNIGFSKNWYLDHSIGAGGVLHDAQTFEIQHISYTKPNAPSTPTNIQVTATDSGTTITWNAAPTVGEYDSRAYEVYLSNLQNDVLIPRTKVDSTSYVSSVVLPEGEYRLILRAVNTKYKNLLSDAQPYDFTILPEPVTYTVSVSATEGGTASGGGTCQSGDSITVTATPSDGYHFVRWTENGSEVSTNAAYTFTATADRALVAVFEQEQGEQPPTPTTYSVSVNASPVAGGTVTGGNTYQAGESVTVTATAAVGYEFKGWTENGSQVSAETSYTFNVNANHVLTAVFEKIVVPTYTVNINANPSVGGTVTGSGTYPSGTSVTVRASASSDYQFVEWQSDGGQMSSDATYTFTVSGNLELVAVFERKQTTPQPLSYSVDVSASPASGGSVAGGGIFEENTSTTVTATANSGYKFVRWVESGATASTAANYTFTMTENRTLTAVFELETPAPTPTCTISVNASPVAGGAVTGGNVYQSGTSVTIAATPNDGYKFVEWRLGDSQISTTASYTFTASATQTYTAIFEKIDTPTPPDPTPTTYTISLSTNPAEGGSVSGGGDYKENTSVTVTATANTNYRFTGWVENGSQVSASATYTFTANADRSLEARFSYIGGNSSNNSGNNNQSTGFTGAPGTTPSIPVSTTETNTGVTTTASPTASIKGNTATSVIIPTIAAEIIRQAVAGDSENVIISPVINGNVTRTEVSIPVSTLEEIGRKTDADVTVSTPVADVTIPSSRLSDLSSGGNVTVTTQRAGDAVELTITAGGQTVEHISGGVSLTVPVADTTPGTVAVIVQEDGTRQVIRRSVAHENTITVPLDGSAKLVIIDNAKTFLDVPGTSWAADAVAFVSGHELFNGTSRDTFSPDSPMTRGMLAVVLHNLENNPEQIFSGAFSDVSGGTWYSEAVTWAAERGIVSGYGNGLFGPGDNITREQLAVMLWRYAGEPAATSKELHFNDADTASGYAVDALRWATENGIINGKGSGILDPKGLATRAQVAQMLMNYLKK